MAKYLLIESTDPLSQSREGAGCLRSSFWRCMFRFRLALSASG